MNTFKIILVGDAGCGKSVLVKRHHTGQFEQKYVATLGVDVTPLRFTTNYGTFVLNIWDCAGDPKFAGLGDGYFIQAQGVIYAFDLTSQVTMNHVHSHIQNVERITGKIPSVIIGNKCDLRNEEKQVSPQLFGDTFRHLRVPLYETSAKTNYQFDKPFLHLLRILTNKDDLTLH